MGELFLDGSPRQDDTPYSISRRGDRKKIQYPGSGIVNELLSPDLRCSMEVIWVEAPLGANSGGHPHSHAGEECGVVLAGRMLFSVGNDEVVLEAGDSIYLDSTVPHSWRASGSEDLRALWVITPPTF
jgi:mannose-6-phosphate isomerase-like protein (cupin superfamily)